MNATTPSPCWSRPTCLLSRCQVGIFLTYSCRHGHTGLDRQLFLPKDWADDPLRRAACHVPDAVVYQEHWQIAVALIERCKDVPHAWIASDSEFGRVVAFGDALHRGGQRYVVEVRADTLVRDRQGRRPRSDNISRNLNEWIPYPLQLTGWPLRHDQRHLDQELGLLNLQQLEQRYGHLERALLAQLCDMLLFLTVQSGASLLQPSLRIVGPPASTRSVPDRTCVASPPATAR